MPFDTAVHIGGAAPVIDQLVSEPLMIPLDVVVLHVLLHRVAQMTFAQRDNLGQALGLDRLDESFRIGVQVRAGARSRNYGARS